MGGQLIVVGRAGGRRRDRRGVNHRWRIGIRHGKDAMTHLRALARQYVERDGADGGRFAHP